MKKWIVFLIILMIIAGIVGFWYYQRDKYSKETLKLEILGPDQVKAAEEFEYIVKYKNNGNTKLENPQLTFECPEHALECALLDRKQSDAQKKSLRKTLSLSDIYPGQEESFHIRVRLLGQEGDSETAKAEMTYRPKGLKAVFSSTTTFTTKISSVPLTFNFDLPSRVEPGKKLRIDLNYFSNIDYPLSNLRIKIDYPLDFEFQGAKPEALEKDEWGIPILNGAEGGRIEVWGILNGEIKSQKIFRARIGLWKEGEFILLKEVTKGVEIAEPSIYISQQINDNPEYIASPGDFLHYQIFFKNIGEEPQTNLFLVVKLVGEGFDLQTIKAPTGEVAGNSIIFDWRKNPSLKFLDAQEEGNCEFWINVKKKWDFSNPEGQNPILKDEVQLSQIKEDFMTKVNSKLEISQSGSFSDKTFFNSGPLPPQVGKVTSYTIIWHVKNYYNNLNDVKVKAKLPSQVKYSGKISPPDYSSKFSYDPVSQEVVWLVGDLKAGESQTCAFQVEFEPKSGRAGEKISKKFMVINTVKATGVDTWTEATIEGTSSALWGNLPSPDVLSPLEESVVE